MSELVPLMTDTQIEIPMEEVKVAEPEVNILSTLLLVESCVTGRKSKLKFFQVVLRHKDTNRWKLFVKSTWGILMVKSEKG